MKRIKDNFPTSQVLKKASPKLRKAIIANCGPDLLRCISETLLNLLQGTFNIPECKKRALTKHKKQLRAIASKKTSLAKKKRLLNEKGGFLILLLSAVLPVLASVVFSSRNKS